MLFIVSSLCACACVCMCVGVYPGYGVLPPDLAAASMAHLAGLGSLSPGGLAYARAAMVCSAFICTISYQLSVLLTRG